VSRNVVLMCWNVNCFKIALGQESIYPLTKKNDTTVFFTYLEIIKLVPNDQKQGDDNDFEKDLFRKPKVCQSSISQYLSSELHYCESIYLVKSIHPKEFPSSGINHKTCFYIPWKNRKCRNKAKYLSNHLE
jgi:hypothetical protein